MDSIVVDSDLESVEKVRAFLKEITSKLGLADEASYPIEVSLVEVCVNITLYAYPQQKGKISVSSWEEDGRLYFEIRDSGIPFDPTKAKTPDLEKHIEEGIKGGLGVFMVSSLMDGFAYKREDDQNVVTLYKNIAALKTGAQ